MATATRALAGDNKNMVQQAVGLFATHMRRNSTMAQLTGKMPTATEAENTVRKQTSTSMPIVRAQDLSKGKGDEVEFNLLNPVNAQPIMGSEMAEGRGVGMSFTVDRLKVNQARFPIDLGDTMTTLRSPVDYRRFGRPVAQSLMDRYIDQSLLVHMAGDRGYNTAFDWTIPLASDPKFNAIMVNRVLPPSKNRHFIVDGTGVQAFKENAGEIDITTTDMFKMDTVDAMKSVLDTESLPTPVIEVENDPSAIDAPLRVWLVSPDQYNKFAADPQFRQIQASAYARASQAKNHPLFMGEVGIWNGFLIKKMPKAIRFYGGNDMRYSPDAYSETVATAKVPASFGTSFAIDRSIILGGQAVAEALAASDKSGIPFFWSEKDLDHGDKKELLIGAIRGVKKIRFGVDTGNGAEITDYGVTVVDTVVPITGLGK